jgi:hypothetical protein
MIRFKWYGFNKHFKQVVDSWDLTTTDVLKGTYPSFFSLDCRDADGGNCKFIAEVLNTGLKDTSPEKDSLYEGDIIVGTDSTGAEIKHLIKYDKENARFSCQLFQPHQILKTESGIYQSWIDEFKKVKIGNIYQNPELWH